MIPFIDSSKRVIGHVEVVQLVTVDDGAICKTAGRSGFDPYFMVIISFDSNGPLCFDKVPTGIFKFPYAMVPDEVVITNGDDFMAARHSTPEQLEFGATPEQIESENVPSDPNLYILDDDELPERLKLLTTADRDRILEKVQAYCTDVYNQKG